MLDLADHTHQINLWISLSKFEHTYSDTLAQHGYICDVIEDRAFLLDNEETDEIYPDIVLTDPTNEQHSLIIDCKSETIGEDQIRRYLKAIENEEQLVTQGIVQDVAVNELSAESIFSSFSDISEQDVDQDIALIHFDMSPYSGLAIYSADDGKFSDERITSTLPINVHPKEPLPTSHYPFDVYEADKESMVSSVLSSVISLSMQEGEFSIEDILDRSQPYWNKLGDKKQEELFEHVKTVFYELRNAGLEEYLEKIAGTEGREWKRTSATIQAINSETDYYVDKVMKELPQMRLDHHTWSPNSQMNREKSEADDDDD